MLNSEIINN